MKQEENKNTETFDAIKKIISEPYLFKKDFEIYELTHSEAVCLAILYVLYGVHKQYKATKFEDGLIFFKAKNDSLQKEIFDFLYSGNKKYEGLYPLYEQLCTFPHSEFEKIYANILLWVTHTNVTAMGYKGDEYYSPLSITSLIAYYIKSNGCKSVFDPFCGTASIVHYFDDKMLYVGQDICKFISLIARVNLEAHYGLDAGINHTDSIQNWNKQSFDAVVLCPFPGAGLDYDYRQALKSENKASLEELLFLRAFEKNKAGLAIMLESSNYFTKHEHIPIRKYLVDNNFLDTIIFLPENIFVATSFAPVLIICKQNREADEPIKFINAEKIYSGDSVRNRSFDTNGFISALETNMDGFCTYISRKQIIEFGYILRSSYYANERITPAEGQQLVTYGDLMTAIEAEKTEISSENDNIYSKWNLKKNFFDIISEKKTSLTKPDIFPMDMSYGYKYHLDSNSTYLLYSESMGEFHMGLVYDAKDFICQPHPIIRIKKINEKLVTPEYLVYLISNNPKISKKILSLDDCMKLPVAIDSLNRQKNIVRTLKSQHIAQAKAKLAEEEKRMGVRQSISDLKHALGTPQLKINSLIEDLEEFGQEDAEYKIKLKKLQDNISYIMRIISHYDENISSSSSPLTDQVNILDFIKQYVEGWSNYRGDVFKIDIKHCDIEPDQTIMTNKDLLTLMFDAILENALRHGFNKIRKDSNRVEIKLSPVSYKDKPYILIAIANNGNELEEGFTIQDYITKGSYSESSGKSGIGGNQVYEIIKKHNGYLYLDSNKTWNMVVEVLLPIENTNASKSIEYEHDCI